VIACIVFLYLKVFVCFIKQACLIAIVSKFGGWGDNNILWLSFAQQKYKIKKENVLIKIDENPLKARQVHNGVAISCRTGSFATRIFFPDCIKLVSLALSCQLTVTPSFFDHFDRPALIKASHF
jgi:hypothetical protein